MNPLYFYKKFEKIIAKLFQLMNYEVETEVFTSSSDRKGIDMVVIGTTKHYIELKFYRSNHIAFSTLMNAANDLAYYLKSHQDGSGIVVTNTHVDVLFKNQIQERLGIYIWDKSVLLSHLTQLSSSLKEEFEQLLLEAQQGTETFSIYSGVDVADALKVAGNVDSPPMQPKTRAAKPPKNSGADFVKRLEQISAGKDQWSQYEKLVFEILRFLFSADLTMWDQQKRSDDTLSRFDLVCRINAFDDYWKALISSFNSRFVLFEFKNYTEKVTQHQIYSTERYLIKKLCGRSALLLVGLEQTVQPFRPQRVL